MAHAAVAAGEYSVYRGMSPLPPDGVAGQHPPHPNLIQATAMHSLITRAREFAVQAHARINHPGAARNGARGAVARIDRRDSVEWPRAPDRDR